MNARTRNIIGSAEKSVARLVEECHKLGPLYAKSPKTVAHVSRTGKWLLNAIAALRQAVDVPRAGGQDKAS